MIFPTLKVLTCVDFYSGTYEYNLLYFIAPSTVHFILLCRTRTSICCTYMYNIYLHQKEKISPCSNRNFNFVILV